MPRCRWPYRRDPVGRPPRHPGLRLGPVRSHGTQAVDLKAPLGSALWCLALVQLGLALWRYGRIPGLRPPPRRVRTVHRLIGLVAFLLSVPIAYRCVAAYGVETTGTRVALHSVSGCALYGAFAAKVLVVRSRFLPGRLLPLVGGALVCAIGPLRYTGALWALNGSDAPGL
ncbi:DUF6529 family protein [Streptomyces sp. SL13]|uniref:DUF6529 family protein n=1 Tax=Streptantibioticus silvisoli TaxID=2705255 RepID=A0AA90GXS7_9ACTN|nr:DUF6529 family protein [Streptantibioticus silvisoli]MDI5968361.1 DUF6529 family protein [Streptantibioticus silvisoli]